LGGLRLLNTSLDATELTHLYAEMTGGAGARLTLVELAVTLHPLADKEVGSVYVMCVCVCVCVLMIAMVCLGCACYYQIATRFDLLAVTRNFISPLSYLFFLLY